jgi:hypothetical protein
VAKAANRSPISDWGVPDPHDRAAYSETATWPEWAWQFLRRRDDYRQRWEEVVWPYINADGSWNLDKEDRDAEEEEIRARREGRAFCWRHPLQIMRDEFKVYSVGLPGANASLDPRLEKPPGFEGDCVAEVQGWSANPLESQFKIDYRLPLEPQLKAVANLARRRSQYLALRQPKDTAPQIDKFPRYLRMLDFHARKASHREIGQSLFPHTTDDRLSYLVRDTLKSAHRYQVDYLLLALRLSDS